MAFGSAFHAMAEENFWQKRTTAKDLPLDLLLDFFRDDLRYRDDVDWKDQDESLDDMTDQGTKTVKGYMETVAPGIQPQVVEHQWSMDVGGRDWKITGKTDLITDGDLVIDLKTGKVPAKPRDGSPRKPKATDAFQVSTYVMGWKAETGQHDVKGRLDFAPRGKSETVSVDVELENAQSIVSAFDNVAGWIQREAWPIFRSHYLCSRKYCDFWEKCEQDCGGTVAH